MKLPQLNIHIALPHSRYIEKARLPCRSSRDPVSKGLIPSFDSTDQVRNGQLSTKAQNKLPTIINNNEGKELKDEIKASFLSIKLNWLDKEINKRRNNKKPKMIKLTINKVVFFKEWLSSRELIKKILHAVKKTIHRNIDPSCALQIELIL